MKNHEEKTSAFSRPQKFVLHMARKGEEWTGRVQSFDWNKEFKFTSLDELRKWLNEHHIEDGAK